MGGLCLPHSGWHLHGDQDEGGGDCRGARRPVLPHRAVQRELREAGGGGDGAEQRVDAPHHQPDARERHQGEGRGGSGGGGATRKVGRSSKTGDACVV